MVLKKNSFFNKLFLYLPLLLLLFLSIFSGIVFNDIFLGISSDFFNGNINSNSIHHLFLSSFFFEKSLLFKKCFPVLLFFYVYFFFDKFNFFFKKNIFIFYFFKLKLYFDFIINNNCLSFKKISFFTVFKALDKGVLEILGPNGLINYSWVMACNLNSLNTANSYNYLCLFLYYFSFLLFFL